MPSRESDPIHRTQYLSRWFLLILTIAAVAWFGTLADRKLTDPDEGRYAEIPREMVASGDWLSPHLNDLKYFEKPPLQYWATAVAYEVFGVGEFTSRLWCGLTGFLGILFAGWASAKLFGKDTGLIAAALLGCSFFWVIQSHINTLDVSLSFFLEVAIFSFLLAQCAPLKSISERNWMWVAWVAAALGILTKGPMAAVLPALTLVVYSLVQRDFLVWSRLHIASGLPLFLVIAAPWFIAMSVANPEFPRYFFIHEHIERFTSTVHGRAESWWFFLPLLVVGALPWVSLAIHGAAHEWRSDAPMSSRSEFRPRRFLLLWVVSVVVFFSASQSKLVPYIAPVFPALAVITGDFVAGAKNTTVGKHIIGVAFMWLVALVLLFVLPTPAIKDASPQVVATLFGWAKAMSAIALVGAGSAWWFAARNRSRDAVIVLSVGTFLGLSALLYGFDVAREVRSCYDLSQTIKPNIHPSKPFYSVSNYCPSMSFYLRRPVTLVNYRSNGEKDLDFGQSQAPEKSLLTVAEFQRSWSTDPPGSLAVIEHRTYNELSAQQVPMLKIGENIDFIAVAKP